MFLLAVIAVCGKHLLLRVPHARLVSVGLRVAPVFSPEAPILAFAFPGGNSANRGQSGFLVGRGFSRDRKIFQRLLPLARLTRAKY